MTTTIETNQPENITPFDSVNGFIDSGFMTEEESSTIIKMPLDQRQELLEKLRTERIERDGESLDEGSSSRFNWIASQLGKNIIDKPVFEEYATSRPVTTDQKAGMNKYAFSGGRHSTGLSSNGPTPDAR
jgi:hypothetical protein